MSFSNIPFSSDPSSITSLGIMLMLTLMLMVFIHYYFYSKASSSNSAAPKEEKSSSNSSEPKTMVSTSTSSIQNSFKYDVFLSFRGEDTRKNFVDHLYHALMDKGIFTYRDDENIQKGKRIRDDLFKSIEDSKFSIIVFSKNYASSSWCLDELVKIMECQTMDGHTAYPVFYDVEPTEVRKQTGAVGVAFAKHKDEKAARKWREALKEASDLAGLELKNTFDGHEAKFIRKIVQEISLELRSIKFGLDEKLVGMETRVKDVVSSLETSVDDVRMLGIWGMGGAGKTTLARAVFDHISVQFESQSFVENVREISKPSLSGLKKLQNQVLSDVLNDNNIRVSSVSDGKNMMKKFLHSRKVLVVLDDVDNIEQLEALTVRNWFKPGSTIIITTRDEQVLRAHGVNMIHGVNLLSNDEAIFMFRWYAFGREIEIEGYKELSRQVVRYAAGLPLTIKVLGSFLCGKDEIEWKDAIERLKTIPLEETLKKLELSYNSLEQDYKEIFLDVACLLRGLGKEYAIRVLESRGFHAKTGLRVLEQKSLITIYENKRLGTMHLGMHDHLEEMGRNIVRRSHPDEPQRHSRLWVKEEIEDILTNDLGTQATKCLLFYSRNFSAGITAVKGLAKMKDLRFIDINFLNDYLLKKGSNVVQFDKVSEYLPSSLRYMRWFGFPFLSLPNTFQGKYLVELELYYSDIVQLWEDGEEKVLPKLRFLTIKRSKLRTFDLRLVPNLEQLTIFQCDDFVELHMPVESVKLEYLELGSLKLKSLRLRNTPSLKKLNIGCDNLVELQMPAESPKLEAVSISDSKLKTLYLGSTPNLKTLTLEESDDLVELQMPAESPNLQYLYLYQSKLKTLHLGSTPNLERLVLEGRNDLVELQMPAESPKLEEVTISHSKLKTLYLGSTPNLKRLTLYGSEDLVELQMPTESSKLEGVDISHSKLKTFYLGSTPNLKRLTLVESDDLVELQMPAESPKLEEVNIFYSKLKTLHLGSTPNLERLVLEGCNDLVELKMPDDSLKLEHLKLNHSKLKTLYLGSTPNLKTLTLEVSDDLVELQMPAESPNLQYLYLYQSKLKTLHLGSTPNLERLVLIDCNDLLELQMPAESPKLEEVKISHSKLKTLYLGSTLNLKRLTLEKSDDLVELQMPAESPKLEEVYISHSKLKTLYLASTPNLKRLALKESDLLVELQMPAESPKLEEVNIIHSALKTLYLGSTPNLKRLILEGCNDLVELKMPDDSLKLEHLELSQSKLTNLHLGNTPNLEKLILEGCNDLVELQMPVESPKLECLYLTNSKLKTLHLGNTPNLKILFLKGCKDLVKLQMRVERLKLECIDFSDTKLKTFDLGLTRNLEWLKLENCYDLVEINAPIGCGRFKSFEFDKIPEHVSTGIWSQPVLVSLSELHLIAEPTDVCPLHPENDSPKFLFECYYKEDPASSFGNLERLISIGLCACINLESFSRSICSLQCLRKLKLEGSISKAPKDLDRLECLEELTFSSTEIKNLPDSICTLKHLKSLKLESCLLLEKLPDDLGRLESLETLILTDCKLLQYIPNSICKMKCIYNLRLRGCIRVVELPEDIGCLEGLKELNIEGTGISHLPQSIFQLRGLRIVGSMRLLATCGLLFKRRRICDDDCYDSDDYDYYYDDDDYDDDDVEIVCYI